MPKNSIPVDKIKCICLSRHYLDWNQFSVKLMGWRNKGSLHCTWCVLDTVHVFNTLRAASLRAAEVSDHYKVPVLFNVKQGQIVTAWEAKKLLIYVPA